MPIAVRKCICLSEQPQGIRPGPNAPVRLEADRGCSFCGGTGDLSITISHDPPPVPLPACDWNASIDGAEYGPIGYGATAADALSDLLIRIEEVPN